MATSSDFYVTGGSLRRDASSYVTRKADEELFTALSRGEFCYILTSRQMGKSSLMIRTAVRLREAGSRTVVLDLTAIGQNLTPEQWYDGLLLDVAQQLDLEDEMDALWERSERLGPLQRFLSALREVALSDRQTTPLFIFIDEIDTARSLPFSTDEFFAAIRECYNRRAKDARFERLTFCLLGVAAPTDLIRDTRMTPFNIGRRIELTDFTLAEAMPLAPDRGGGTLGRVLYWTGGHPYLTQRLCQAVAEDAIENQKSKIETQDVDRLCEALFLSQQAQQRDDNLIFVRERLLRSEEDRASLLDLYGWVRSGQRVKNDEANPLVALLRLSGIVRSQESLLAVRNRIYEQVFDKTWIRENMPDAELRRQKKAFQRGVARTLFVASILLVLLFSGVLLSRRQTHLKIRNTLPDGRTITIEDVTYGKIHHYESGPFRWRGLLPGGINRPRVTDTNCLEAWITYHEKGKEGMADDFAPPILIAAFDEHGCCFEAQWTYDTDNFASRLPSYLYTSFPRRGQFVNMRVFDRNASSIVEVKPITEFFVPNPAPTLYPLWTPEPLPITKQAGDLSITLTGLQSEVSSFGRAPNNYRLLPTFRFAVNGRVTEEWEADGFFELSDATGNVSGAGPAGNEPCNLCPYEPAWKMNVRFFRKKTAVFTPEEAWTMKGVTMPGPGELRLLSRTITQNGSTVALTSIAGPGIYSYVGGVGKFLGKWDKTKPGEKALASPLTQNAVSVPDTYGNALPHLKINASSLKRDQILTVWATDAKGRRFNMGWNSPSFVDLPIPPDVKTIDLHFVIQTGRKAEFLIKPPLPPIKKDK